MENGPMNGNSPQMPGYGFQQPALMPPEIQRMIERKSLRKAGNRISGLLLLLVAYSIPTTFLIAIVWTIANRTYVMNLLQDQGMEGLMQAMMGNSGLMLALSVLASGAALFFTLLTAKPMLKQKVFGAWRKPKGGAGTIFGGLALMLGAGLIGSLLVNLISVLFNLFGIKNGTPDFSLNGSVETNAIVIAYVCVIGPILEETLFRGVILQSLKPWGNRFAIIVSALLFGLFHLNIIQGVNAAVIGLVLGFIAVKSESVLPCILMHIANNSFSMVLTVAGEKNMMAQYIYLALMVVCLLISIVLFLQYRPQVFELWNRPAAVPAKHKYPVFFFQSAGVWALIVLFVIYCVNLASVASNLVTKY